MEEACGRRQQGGVVGLREGRVVVRRTENRKRENVNLAGRKKKKKKKEKWAMNESQRG